ncbi:MAG: M48 family metalloprotease [Acidobacteria bacterium]|nr:M48 family metalloprotease [Acidobacteriota bacterium]
MGSHFPRVSFALLFASMAWMAEGQSTDYDKKIGAEAADQVLRTKGVYDDPQLEKFLQGLGARLVEQLGTQPFTYLFRVSDEADPNAYALPGGFVFATRGIFAVAASEDELAGVLGHEVIHSDRRHAVKAMRHSILPGILAVPGALAGVFSEEAGKVLSAPSSMAMAKYSRKNEDEADRLGTALAAKAGYDPLALRRCLTRLSKTVEAFTGEKEKGGFFADHPSTPERDAEIAKLAASLQRGTAHPVLPSREAYLKLIDGLVVGKNPAQGLFEKNVFTHADLNFRMEMPEGWKTFNTVSAFGAYHEKGKGQLLVGLAEGRDPELAGRETAGQIEVKAKMKPVEARRLEVNGYPAFYVLFVHKKSNLHMLWVSMGGKMFRMAGIGVDEYMQALKTSVGSLRPLTAGERAAVKVTRLRLVAAKAGESVEAFSKRTGNTMKPALTEALNDLDGAPLKDGQVLKIVRSEAYR